MATPKRDLQAEQRAVGQFRGKTGGRMPDLNNPNDRAEVYRLAYPVAGGGLPDELKSTVDQSLYAGGQTSASNTPLSQNVAGSNLGQLQQDVTTAAAGVEKMSQPNEALRILQEAIREKSGMANQPIGESELFKAAGVTGYGALAGSIAETGKKLDNDFANFSNIVSQMSGTYEDMANLALKKYQMSYTAFKDESDRLQKIMDDIADREHEFNIIKKTNDAAKELEDYRNTHLSPAEKAELDAKGYTPSGDPKSAFQIVSPSGNSYDWTTYNAPGGVEYVRSVQNSIDSIGKLADENALRNYINTKMPNAKFNATDIIDISKETGVGWEELLGLIQKEAPGGASGVARKNNNFGGVTWSQTYQDAHPNVTKGSARPAAEGGYYVKFKDARDGLRAQAEQFTKRKIGTSSNTGTEPNILDIDTIEQMYYKGGTEKERTARRNEIKKALTGKTTEQYIAEHPIGDRTKWQKNSEIFQAISQYITDGEWEITDYPQKIKFITENGGDPKDFESVMY